MQRRGQPAWKTCARQGMKDLTREVDYFEKNKTEILKLKNITQKTKLLLRDKLSIAEEES